MGEAFHYYHHRFFDVNFAGGGVTFLDEWFGSGYFGPTSSSSTTKPKTDQIMNNNNNNKDQKSTSTLERLNKINAETFGEILENAPSDEKATLNPLPLLSSKDGMISPFMILTVTCCWGPWIYYVSSSSANSRNDGQTTIDHEDDDNLRFRFAISFLASFGPLILAVFLDVISYYYSSKQQQSPSIQYYLTRPFGAKRPIWETLLHLIVGLSMSALPVFVILYLAL